MEEVNKFLKKAITTMSVIFIIVGLVLIFTWNVNSESEMSNNVQYVEMSQYKQSSFDTESPNLVLGHRFVNRVDDTSNSIIKVDKTYYFVQDEINKINTKTSVITRDGLVYVE